MLEFSEFQWVIAALGWTIIHSLWQFLIISFLWFIGFLILKKNDTSGQYSLSVLAMVLIVMTSGLTLFSELQTRSPVKNDVFNAKEIASPVPSNIDYDIAENGTKQPMVLEKDTEITAVKTFETPKWLSSSGLTFLVFFWCFGVLVFGFRFLIQWFGLRKLSTKGIRLFEPEQIAVFQQLKNRMGIKRSISFLQSTLVTAPLTFGHFKPIILLPVGMVTGFPPKQIEAIILHELAHIGRNDFLINLIQVWLEVLFFYHPLVWIISKKIRTLREELCDDEVILTNKDKIIYAESLLNIQKYFLHNKNLMIMNATNKKSELSSRIHRLFQSEPSVKKRKGGINAFVFGLIMVFAIGSYAFSSLSFPTVSVAADKMNVFYIGVENPITVAVAGVTSENVKVESEDLELINRGDGHYIVKATKSGNAVLRIIADGHAPKNMVFRVKHIPDPIAMINQSKGGRVSAESMKKAEGLDAVLAPFDFDTTCEIMSFSMVLVEANKDYAEESINRSAKFNEKTKRLLSRLKVKDLLYFDNVTCKCPGDTENRLINSMVFKME